jgi:hypothetical protein
MAGTTVLCTQYPARVTTKAKWLPSEATSYDLLMLPHPDLVNREAM